MSRSARSRVDEVISPSEIETGNAIFVDVEAIASKSCGQSEGDTSVQKGSTALGFFSTPDALKMSLELVRANAPTVIFSQSGRKASLRPDCTNLRQVAN